jgi:flagellar hook-basal body complex protein FliE
MVDISSIQSSVAVQGAYKAAASAQSKQSTEIGSGFEDLVSKAATDAVATIRQGDAIARASLEGKVGIQQVVEATMAMESTVKTSVALRDKLVEAYHEILKMPV